MIFKFILRVKRSVYIRCSRVFVRWLASLQGVGMGDSVAFIGRPVIQMANCSRIEVGARCLMISTPWASALGINHSIVLRTLQEGAGLIIGEGTGISGGTFCASRSVIIGNNCLFGANVTVVDTDFHHINPVLRRDPASCHLDALPILIGDNVFVGASAIILKGVTIGDNSVIGAGSVVTKSIPANVIAAGNPCTVIRSLGDEGRV